MQQSVVAIAVIAIVALTLSNVLKMWLNRPGRAGPPQADLKEIRDGLGQLQQAVDVIALEVERLSEGQRFTTRLLAEKAKEGVSITPSGRP
jgi:hypothetical protein